MINGTPQPIHFGLRVINDLSKAGDLEFGDVLSGEGLDGIEKIVQLAMMGLNEAAKINRLPDRYTEEDVWFMFDNEPNLMVDVVEAFTESITPLTEKLGSMGKSTPQPEKRAPKSTK